MKIYFECYKKEAIFEALKHAAQVHSADVSSVCEVNFANFESDNSSPHGILSVLKSFLAVRKFRVVRFSFWHFVSEELFMEKLIGFFTELKKALKSVLFGFLFNIGGCSSPYAVIEKVMRITEVTEASQLILYKNDTLETSNDVLPDNCLKLLAESKLQHIDIKGFLLKQNTLHKMLTENEMLCFLSVQVKNHLYRSTKRMIRSRIRDQDNFIISVTHGKGKQLVSESDWKFQQAKEAWSQYLSCSIAQGLVESEIIPKVLVLNLIHLDFLQIMSDADQPIKPSLETEFYKIYNVQVEGDKWTEGVEKPKVFFPPTATFRESPEAKYIGLKESSFEEFREGFDFSYSVKKTKNSVSPSFQMKVIETSYRLDTIRTWIYQDLMLIYLLIDENNRDMVEALMDNLRQQASQATVILVYEGDPPSHYQFQYQILGIKLEMSEDQLTTLRTEVVQAFKRRCCRPVTPVNFVRPLIRKTFRNVYMTHGKPVLSEVEIDKILANHGINRNAALEPLQTICADGFSYFLTTSGEYFIVDMKWAYSKLAELTLFLDSEQYCDNVADGLLQIEFDGAQNVRSLESVEWKVWWAWAYQIGTVTKWPCFNPQVTLPGMFTNALCVLRDADLEFLNKILEKETTLTNCLMYYYSIQTELRLKTNVLDLFCLNHIQNVPGLQEFLNVKKMSILNTSLSVVDSHMLSVFEEAGMEARAFFVNPQDTSLVSPYRGRKKKINNDKPVSIIFGLVHNFLMRTQKLVLDQEEIEETFSSALFSYKKIRKVLEHLHGQKKIIFIKRVGLNSGDILIVRPRKILLALARIFSSRNPDPRNSREIENELKYFSNHGIISKNVLKHHLWAEIPVEERETILQLFIRIGLLADYIFPVIGFDSSENIFVPGMMNGFQRLSQNINPNRNRNFKLKKSFCLNHNLTLGMAFYERYLSFFVTLSSQTGSEHTPFISHGFAQIDIKKALVSIAWVPNKSLLEVTIGADQQEEIEFMESSLRRFDSTIKSNSSGSRTKTPNIVDVLRRFARRQTEASNVFFLKAKLSTPQMGKVIFARKLLGKDGIFVSDSLSSSRCVVILLTKSFVREWMDYGQRAKTGVMWARNKIKDHILFLSLEADLIDKRENIDIADLQRDISGGCDYKVFDVSSSPQSYNEKLFQVSSFVQGLKEEIYG